MFTFVNTEGGGGGVTPCAERMAHRIPPLSGGGWLDRTIGAALAPGAAAVLARRIAEAAGDAALVLDVGCGASSPMIAAGVRAIGIDIRPAAAKAHARSAPAAAADATALPFADAAFDLVWSCGLLHHLDDDAAAAAISEMLRVTAPGGRTIVFDGVWPAPAWRRPLAALIRAADRGRHMRTETALAALLPAGRGWRRERIRYAATGLEGLWCERLKEVA